MWQSPVRERRSLLWTWGYHICVWMYWRIWWWILSNPAVTKQCYDIIKLKYNAVLLWILQLLLMLVFFYYLFYFFFYLFSFFIYFFLLFYCLLVLLLLILVPRLLLKLLLLLLLPFYYLFNNLLYFTSSTIVFPILIFLLPNLQLLPFHLPLLLCQLLSTSLTLLSHTSVSSSTSINLILLVSHIYKTLATNWPFIVLVKSVIIRICYINSRI